MAYIINLDKLSSGYALLRQALAILNLKKIISQFKVETCEDQGPEDDQVRIDAREERERGYPSYKDESS